MAANGSPPRSGKSAKSAASRARASRLHPAFAPPRSGRGQFPERGGGNVRGEPDAEPQFLDEIEVRRAGAAVVPTATLIPASSISASGGEDGESRRASAGSRRRSPCLGRGVAARRRRSSSRATAARGNTAGPRPVQNGWRPPANVGTSASQSSSIAHSSLNGPACSARKLSECGVSARWSPMGDHAIAQTSTASGDIRPTPRIRGMRHQRDAKKLRCEA